MSNYTYVFHKWINNPTAPSGRVAMYEIRDSQNNTWCTVGIDVADNTNHEKIGKLVGALNAQLEVLRNILSCGRTSTQIEGGLK